MLKFLVILFENLIKFENIHGKLNLAKYSFNFVSVSLEPN